MTGGRPESAALPVAETVLLLVRHAEQRTMRLPDAELSQRGQRQAGLLAQRLARLPLSAVVASPLRRARQTAAAIGAATGLEVEVEDGLEEVHLTPEERERRYSQSAARAMEPEDGDGAYARTALAMVRVLPRTRWAEDRGTESMESLRARGVAAVERVLARHHAGAVACVSHGGLINAVLGAWTGATADLWFVPWHTGISTVLARGDERILIGLNDASHLAAAEEPLDLVTRSVRRPPSASG